METTMHYIEYCCWHKNIS